MINSHGSNLYRLVESELGSVKADDVFATVEIDAFLFRYAADVTPPEMAMALNLVLFSHLIDDVPEGASYVAGRKEVGEKITFDHGALRTVRFPGGLIGQLPSGASAITRILEPLGYRMRKVYPLPALQMTGFAWTYEEYPYSIPQFFISELNVDAFSQEFQCAARRVFATSQDPLGHQTLLKLEDFSRTKSLPISAAQDLIAELVPAFGRQHTVFEASDYEALKLESAEAAWIATEGNTFNHATDRVADVQLLAEHLRNKGFSIKDVVERSASGSVRQTALKAATVERTFRVGSELDRRLVPGSFFEFISRDVESSSGKLDLNFDSSNAQGIFAMTKAV